MHPGCSIREDQSSPQKIGSAVTGCEVNMVVNELKRNVLAFPSLLAFLAVASPSSATTYYVLAGGTGSFAGTDWANANCQIPATLNPGDVVYIGNSGGNLADTTTACAGEAKHVFSTSGTVGSHITIKAATGADHGTGTGWSASYGVDVTPAITWSNTHVPADGIIQPFWDMCGSYYDVNGEVGSADQTGTYGFYFKSAGDMFGFIRADANQCSGNPTITNLTFQYFEINGVEADSINGGGGSTGLYFGSPSSGGSPVNNITVSYFYLHDLFSPTGEEGNMTALTYSNGWIYTNFGNAASHSQGIDASANSNGSLALNNLTVDSVVWKNIQGTGFIMCLHGSCDSWKIYNNIFYYSSDWDSACEHGDVTASCQVSKVLGDNGSGSTLTNLTFYGNTISNIHIKPGHSGGDNAGVIITASTSGSNDIRNNFWYYCDEADLGYDGANGHPTLATHDYNTWSNTDISGTLMTLAAHDFQNSTKESPTQPDPFVSDATGNFNLSSETVDAHLNDGVSLAAPYNLDFAGATRGADGTWERGAFEFNSTPTKPNPPTNLAVTGVH